MGVCVIVLVCAKKSRHKNTGRIYTGESVIFKYDYRKTFIDVVFDEKKVEGVQIGVRRKSIPSTSSNKCKKVGRSKTFQA